ncbi:MAG: amino acid adenylation domain-containing protein [Almyronema sp.]
MNEFAKRIAALSPEQRTLLAQQLQRRHSQPVTPPPLPRRQAEDGLPLSFSQQRLWFLDQFQGQSPEYNISAALRWQGPINLAVLERVFNEMVRRHEVLRTTFPAVEGQPIQAIAPTLSLPLRIVDLQNLSVQQRERELQQLAQLELRWPFDLTQGPLMRTTLLTWGDADAWLLVTLHHIIADGWCRGIFLQELTILYQAFIQGQPSPLAALPLQYADFAHWQRQQLQGEALERQLAYWRRQLQDSPALLDLPTDRPRPAVQTFRGTRCFFALSPDLVQALKTLAQQQGVTLFMTLLAAFQTLLYRYTGQTDILVGSPIANRTHPALESLIGFFANTLVLRTDLSGDPSFLTLLQRVQTTALDAYTHQDVPFEKLIEALPVARNLSYSPLFQVMFVLQGVPLASTTLPNLTLEPIRVDSGTARFDLMLNLSQTSSGSLEGICEYNTDLFDATTIERLLDHFQVLLNGVVTHPQQRLSQLPLLSEAARHQLLAEWNATQTEDAPSPAQGCLHHQIALQAEKTPAAIALSWADQHLSYRELNARANQLAHHLQQLGVAPGTLVGLCLERSLEMVIGMLAILKAGGAYLPLDPAYPTERLALVLNDAPVLLLLTQTSLLAKLPAQTPPTFCLDRNWPTLATYPTDNLPLLMTPEQLAYVIYTSGSTGKPKGVQIPHRAVVNFLQSMQRQPGLVPQDVMLAVTTIAFDIAGLELFLPLVTGARVVLTDRLTAADGSLLAALIDRTQATVMQATPATWQLLIAAGWSGKPDLKLLCGGEALSHALAAALRQRCGSLWNLYGPTETTIWSALHRVAPEPPAAAASTAIPLGRAIANTQLYVLDRHLQPVPIGVPGELYIGGAGLAQGYLNQPGLTAEKFVPNPFLAEFKIQNSKFTASSPHLAIDSSTLYKTGDRVRYRADGTLDFLGRIDYQVKLRGFRIELGEIEAALDQHPSVQKSVVVDRDVQGDRRLVAYIQSEQAMDATEMRSYLRQILPDYMVPAAFVLLAALPLTPNGKINRRSLPEPQWQPPTPLSTRPQTPVEACLVEIWSQVLHLKTVGIDDNFFELGGHSLLATQIMAQVERHFQIALPLRQLFETPTIAAFAIALETTRQERAPQVVAAIAPVERTQPLPLSFAQQRLWFLAQLEPDSPFYALPATIRLAGSLNIPALYHSLQEIVRRHESLRMRFPIHQTQPVVEIRPDMALPLPVIDLSALAATAQSAALQQQVEVNARQPFDLATDWLLRVRLLKLSDREHRLLIAMHHIVTDGWSIGVLRQELTILYAAYCQQQPAPLPPLPIQYVDFAAWQRQWLQGERLSAQLDYWQQQLADLPGALSLPTDYPRPPIQTFCGSSYEFTLSRDLTDRLQALSQQQGCTLFMTLLAGFALLLSRYSHSDDIVVGSPIANRTRPELEPLIGCFVNTLVLRSDLSQNPTVKDLLGRVRAMALAAYAHQDLPFEQLVEAIQPERDLSHTPLFQVMFVLQTPPQPLQLPELAVDLAASDRPVAKFDLTLSMTATPTGLTAHLEYSTDLFAAATIERLAGHLQTLWTAMTAHPDWPIGELPLLTPSERQQWLQGHTAPTSVPDGTVIDWIERQVNRTPNAIAVIDGDQQLTYRQLDQQANQLAHYLQQQGIGPERLVGLCVERSLAMVVGVLAVLKAGGAYVPLDPTYPEARLAYMLKDAQVAVLLTQQSCLAKLPTLPIPCLCLDTDREAIAQHPATFSGVSRHPDQLAYVIYTSGSTGNPKGTLITQRGLANYLHWCTQAYAVKQGQGTLVHSSLAFDLTITGLFSPLLVGQSVELVTPAWGIEALAMALRQRSQLSLVKITPAQLQLLAEQLDPAEAANCTNAFVIGGENLRPEHIAFWQRYAPTTRLINEYGPTETVVGCCVYTVPPDSSYSGPIPIGRAIANTELYVLDQHYQLVPSGVVGELYIGGAGLARGYLHRPDLTAAVFIPHPFSATPGARLYKTGDLARYRPDGTLECLARLDHQVKIRGFRIELGEVETALNQHPQVQQAVVLAEAALGNSQQLVAYVVWASETGTPADLRRWLKTKLPDYMVPAVFVALERLPLTANGKVDRRQLPQLTEAQAIAAATTAIAFRTPVEEILVGIWQAVLQQKAVGLQNNFFELGGHSLLATQVISQMRQAFQMEIPLRHLFEFPTVAELAASVERLQLTATATSLPPLKPRDKAEPLPLSFAQQRLWFLAQLEPASPFYNVPAAVRLQGDLNISALQRSLATLVNRHEVLRTAFAAQAGQPVPVVSETVALPLPLIDLSALPISQQDKVVSDLAQAEAQQPFALNCSPLLRVRLVQMQPQVQVLLLTLHHLVSDGWSMGVFIQEMADLYQAFCQEQPSPLAELPLQYGDFATWQRQYLQGDRLASQLAYWQQQLAGAPPVLELPYDYPRPAVQTFRGERYTFSLSAAQTQGLKQFSQQQNCTLFMTLLTAFQILLARYSGHDDIVVGSPIANRNRAEIEGLIGFFVNTLVLRTDLSGQPTVQQALHRVREVALAAYAHQDLPFERLVEALQPERSLSHAPLFQVMFIWQNAPTAALALPGLSLSLIESQTQAAKFDLTLSLRETDAGISGALDYNCDLFTAATITRLVAHWQQILAVMVAAPSQPISAIDLLTPQEHRQIQAWNQTEAVYPPVCLPDLVAAQVVQTPDAVALCYQQQQLTYGELSRRAHRLAHHLRSLGVQAGQRVGISLARSPDLVIALLAVLQTGAAYVPLDPAYPLARRRFILENAGIAVLVTQQPETATALPPNIQIVCLERDRFVIEQASSEPLPALATPETLAYVLYTSGSTGKPKGVQVPHRAVVNFLQSMQRTPGLSAVDVLLSVTTIAFDIAALEIFLPLISGAKVVLIDPAATADGRQMATQIETAQATVMQATPATWQLLLASGWSSDRPLKLLCGGEALSYPLAEALHQRGETLWNLYGPTEATIWSAVHRVSPLLTAETPSAQTTVSVGRPIANTQFYVLDQQQNPVPVGVPGELHIGGTGLAWGYLYRPDLTAEKFIPNPFQTADSPPQFSRLYKTGDRVRYRSDGTLEFLGRLDHQVKIRGFRIELGEIEAQLLQQPAIGNAVVVTDATTDHQTLVAYLVRHPQAKLEREEVREFLRQTLPDYMVPSTYVQLEALPLTPNGKVDRRALPAPQQQTRLSPCQTYLAPRNQLEQTIAQVWQQVLALETVGVNDNFFDLGGHSLRLVQVQSQLQHHLAVELPLLDLFRYPTVASLAAFLSRQGTGADQPTNPQTKRDRTQQIQQGKDRLRQFRQLSPFKT